MNQTQTGHSRGFFRLLWDAINFSRRLLVNIIFVLFVIVIIVAITSEKDQLTVPSSAALVLNPAGRVVEQLEYVDPAEELLNQELNNQYRSNAEVLLGDVVKVIDNAAQDKRIKVLVLKLGAFGGGGLNKLKTIGDALERFKASGKQIIAIGDYYTQNQYYLASYADEIILNPMGGVLIDGFGIEQLYYKEALAKLKVSRHIFKVGKFKSAVEPYDRQNMSEEAKLANQVWLDELWQNYKTHIATQRNMPESNFDESLDDYLAKLRQTQGDMAQYALDNQWVDSLKSRQQINQQLVDLVGSDNNNRYNQVDYYDYLGLVKPPVVLDNPFSDKVAVVVARGQIFDGNQKAGSVGGDSTANLLRRARLDKTVKAVVLRVDSPGGSAFASEIIRKEIDALQQAGKPVVASMSSVAASGGYWISASTDEIWASPTTITGSIGIYGMFMTFENSLSAIGVSSDGVATTEMANFSVYSPLEPKLGEVIQLNIEKGYQRFIELVANNRNMTTEQVNEIAQGRVWTGATAKKLGLVDQLGDLDQAIASAASKASLGDYDVKVIEQELSARDQFYRDWFGVSTQPASTSKVNVNKAFDANQMLMAFKQQLDMLTRFNDPQHMYVHCEVCEGF